MAIHVNITLSPNAVAAPTLGALRDTLEVISICFPAIEGATNVPILSGNGMDFRIEPTQPAEMDERRPVYKQWMLSKGFHELAKGLHRSLEEACLYVEVLKMGGGYRKWGDLQKAVDGIKKKANDARFPELMAWVNAGLSEKLHFDREFHSLNKTRNCLEHRHGIVGDRDVDKDTGVLVLALPRMKVFFVKDGVETEIAIGQVFEKDTKIFMKRVTSEVSYKVGEKISFTVDEFKTIAFACWMFVQDLVSKLPQVPATKPTHT